MSATIVMRPMGGAAYGSEELKQAAHRYGFLGLLVSVVIHFAAIGVYYILPVESNKPYYPPPGTGETVIEVTTGFSIPETLPPPVIHTPISDIQNVHEGTPVPVLETPTSTETIIPSQGDMGQGGSNAGVAGTGMSHGTGLPITIDDDIPPPIFVPVEKNPVIIKAVRPVYPALAIQAGLEGRVVVKIWVDRQGKARKAEILKSEFDVFNQAALDAAVQYVFTPAYMNGGPVSVWVSVPFRFKLK